MNSFERGVWDVLFNSVFSLRRGNINIQSEREKKKKSRERNKVLSCINHVVFIVVVCFLDPFSSGLILKSSKGDPLFF